MNWRESCLLGAVFAALTALGLYIFPGHTFLSSDTQIYLPLFTHLSNPQLLNNELILSGAHLNYTIYDEVTLSLSKLFHLDFETILFAQQFLFRWIGYWGAYWLARAVGLSLSASILASSLLWLGAFIFGPAILTTEFEPVPRGFAVPLLVAALGALSRNYNNLAGNLLAIAFLYHPPAVWPILSVALLARHWRLLAYTAAATAILLVSAYFQQGFVHAQPFFSLIEAGHRTIMRTRAPYNWISLWPWQLWAQFLISGALALLAFQHLRDLIPAILHPYFRIIPWIGLATMPLSWLLLENLGWALFPQAQPMRALLFCHLFCQWLGILAAWRELKDGQWLKAAAWLIVPLTISLRGNLLQIPADQLNKQFLLLAILLPAVWLAHRFPKPQLAIAASFLLAITFGEVLQARLYKPFESPALDSLSQWAQTRTPIDAQFFFPDIGRRMEPGIFRAKSARAVYVCWKQGGQVNYFPKYAAIWWERWSNLLAPNHPPLDYNDLRRRGITHLAFTQDTPTEDLTPVYVSPAYRVYQLNP
jgi:hypothetical protein